MIEPSVRRINPFFVAFKERVKLRFGQIDVWIVTYPIELI
jgi:hypothetical protein